LVVSDGYARPALALAFFATSLQQVPSRPRRMADEAVLGGGFARTRFA
jgi:hypothetical protein